MPFLIPLYTQNERSQIIMTKRGQAIVIALLIINIVLEIVSLITK